MKYEQAVETCLGYLHQHQNQPSASPVQQALERDLGSNLNIVFTWGGNASRWDDFMGMPKQLLDTGDDLPLVQRSVNQFRAVLPGATCYLLARCERNDFAFIEGIQCISRVDQYDRPILMEILTKSEVLLAEKRDILVVYGDVYFSDQAIRRIRNKVIADDCALCFFGRRHQNLRYGNTGGEDFAVYLPRDSWRSVLDYHALLGRIYIGTRLYRYGTWELITLLSVLKQKQSTYALPAPELIGNDVGQTFKMMASIWQCKDFHPRHWIEIDDETEDFDFPCEYVERIFRMVQWVGAAVEGLAAM